MSVLAPTLAWAGPPVELGEGTPVQEIQREHAAAPEFESAAAWRAWAKEERRRLAWERARLKLALAEARDPSAQRYRTNLATKREHVKVKRHRAQKRADADAVARFERDIEQLDQQIADLDERLAEVDERRDALRTNRNALNRTKNFRILPFLGPAYSPELEFVFAGGLAATWSFEPHNPYLPVSSVTGSGGVSTSGASLANAKLSSFMLDDRLRAFADFNFKDMPDNYWGVGYDAARRVSDPNGQTAYRRTWLWVSPEVLAQIDVRGLYAGLRYDANYTNATKVSDEISMDPDFRRFGPKNFNSGFGFTVMFDNRDVPLNAYSGLLAKVSLTRFSPSFGSDNTYSILDLDYRQYVTLVREGSTLAWQVRSKMGFGDVPYGDMPLLGSPFDLRGYYWGRYRDDSMVFGLVEYRYMFRRRTVARDGRELSRNGAVVWLGGGSLGGDLTEWTRWLPNGGIGYRLQIQPRMNARIDLGFGNDTFSAYLQFYESF